MKKIIIFLVLVMSLCLIGSDRRFLDEAIDFYLNGDYGKAAGNLQIISQDMKQTADYLELSGQINLAQRDFESAYLDYKKYTEICDAGSLSRGLEVLGIIENIIAAGLNEEKKIDIEHLAGEINTGFSEFTPVFNQEEDKIYYTSNRSCLLAKENIWQAENREGLWINSRLITQFSGNGNESMGSFSKDGSYAYIFGNFSGSENGDIFKLEKMDNQWSEPLRVKGVNSPYLELHPFISGEFLFFASNRPDGYGGLDLFVIDLSKENGIPMNLGPQINTAKDEETPYLDRDGKTLFFASNGHAGLGNLDIFKTISQDQTWENWSKVENMGDKYNSVKNDRGLVRGSEEGDWFLSSDRAGGKGGEDIYRIHESFNDQKIAITNLSGSILTLEGSTVKFQNLRIIAADGTLERIVQSDSVGNYQVSLPVNREYKFFIDRKGFESIKETLTLVPIKEQKYDFVLKKIIKKKKTEISNIYFESDSAILKEESFDALNELVRTLQLNYDLNAVITGYTDSIGEIEYNKMLSKKRAEAVVKYLIKNKVEPKRLISKGRGESDPVGDNSNREGREINRRVEIEFIEH